MIKDQSAEASQSYGPTTTTSQANGVGGQAGLVNSATGAAGALAGWAIASLGKQLQSSEVHSSLSAQPGLSAPVAAPRPSSDSVSSFSSAGPSTSTYKITPAPAPVRAKPQTGMRLGATKAAPLGGSSLVDSLAGEFEEDGDEVAKAWGTDDLMDVNADEDDWSRSRCYIAVADVQALSRLLLSQRLLYLRHNLTMSIRPNRRPPPSLLLSLHPRLCQ